MTERKLTTIGLFGVLACAGGCGPEPEPEPQRKPTSDCRAHEPTEPSERAEASLLWSYERPDEPEPKSVALGLDARHAFVGLDQLGGLMFTVDGDGEPEWSFDVEVGSFSTVAAVEQDVFYGVVSDAFPGEPADFAVSQFAADSANPRWTYDANAAGFKPGDSIFVPGALHNTAAITPDGALLAIAGAQEDQLAIAFFTGEPEPNAVYLTGETADSRFSTSLQLSSDGSTFFYSVHNRFHRGNVATQTLEASVDLFFGTGVASADGELMLRLGYNLLVAYRWTGGTYEPFWMHRPDDSGFADAAGASAAAIAADGDRIVVGWNHEDERGVTVTAFSLSEGTCPLWTYRTPEGIAGQDIVSALRMSDDTEWVAVGTWGTMDNAHPEFFLLRASDPREPFFAIDTPGSVNLVSMTADASTIVAAGRGVHNGTFGFGSAIYAVRLTRD